MKNQMGFIVNDSDYNAKSDDHYGMGFFDYSDLEELATSVGESVKDSAEKNLVSLADKEIQKLLGNDKGKVVTAADGTQKIIIEKQAPAPQTQYMQQPSQIPTWAWILVGTVGVGLLGLITYKVLQD